MQPDDARNAVNAVINQIPASMEATRTALEFLASITHGSMGKPNNEALKVFSVLTSCVLQLDNRIERLEGRPGVPPEQLVSLFQEFDAGNS